MAKYHVNPNTGNSSACKATKGGCPFGGADGQENHYTTPQEAQQAAEKLMAENHSAINAAYRKKDTSGLANMSSEIKKRIIAESTMEGSKLHPSVVAKVLSTDKDELIRKKVSESFKSQKILREMADDESARVRLAVAKATNNPKLLATFANDPDSKVRSAAIANKNVPIKAKKTALAEAKAKKVTNLKKATAKNKPETQDITESKPAKTTGMPTVKPKPTKKITEKVFNAKNQYHDNNYIPITEGVNAYVRSNSNLEFTVVGDKNDPYEVNLSFDKVGLDPEEKEDLGFNADDNVKPFINIATKRNVMWQTSGFEVNGEKKYLDMFRYEVDNGADLEKSIKIAQKNVNNMVEHSLEDRFNVAEKLVSSSWNLDAIDAGNMKSLNAEFF